MQEALSNYYLYSHMEFHHICLFIYLRIYLRIYVSIRIYVPCRLFLFKLFIDFIIILKIIITMTNITIIRSHPVRIRSVVVVVTAIVVHVVDVRRIVRRACNIYPRIFNYSSDSLSKYWIVIPNFSFPTLIVFLIIPIIRLISLLAISPNSSHKYSETVILSPGSNFLFPFSIC